MEFKQLAQLRRSVRGKYTETQTDHEDIINIIKTAQQAPSWKNWQASRIYVAESQEFLEKFRLEALPEFNQQSSKNAVLLVSTFVRDLVGFDNGEPANELGNLWGAYDLGLRDAYLILAAKDAGYDTLIMGLRDSEKIRQMMDIPENEEIVSVIALGKASEPGKDRKRKEFEEIAKFY